MCTTRSRRRAASADSLLRMLAAAAVMLAIAPSLVHALSSDRDQDLNIRAQYNKNVVGNAGKVDQAGHALFTGNVRLEQGSLKASGDEARLYEAKSDNDGQRMVLTGTPARLEQKLDDGGSMNAQAATIDYNDGNGIAILTGDVVVIQQGKSEFRGPRMTYNTATGAMEGGDATPGSEVHLIFKPKKRAPATEKPAGGSDS